MWLVFFVVSVSARTNYLGLQTIWSLVVYGTSVGIQFGAPHLFYRIVGLILYSLAVIFWLAGWAYAASQAALVLDWAGPNDYGSALAVCAGLGAVAW